MIRIEYKDGRIEKVATMAQAEALLYAEWEDADYESHSDRRIVYPHESAEEPVAIIYETKTPLDNPTDS